MFDPLSATELGLRFPLDWGGYPLTLRFTVPLNPPAADTVMLVLPVVPCGTVKFDPEREKLPLVAAGLTVRVALALVLL